MIKFGYLPDAQDTPPKKRAGGAGGAKGSWGGNEGGVRVPQEWYTAQLQDFLSSYAHILSNVPSQFGWSVWLMIHTAHSRLIGVGFIGSQISQKP